MSLALSELKFKAFLFVVFFCFTALADEPRYMLVTIDGAKCGYAVNQRVEKDGLVETSEEVKLTINRLGFTMEVTEKTSYTETAGGEPVGFETEQKFSGAPAQITKGVVKDGKLKLTRTGESPSILDFNSQSLMPEGVRLLLLEKGVSTGSVFDIEIFDAALAQSFPAKIEVFDKESIDLLGRVKELYKVVTTTTIPGAGDIRLIGYVDDEFEPYKSSTWLMGMTIEMIACPREVAVAAVDPADLFSNLLLVSPVKIPVEAIDEPITYTLTIKTDGKDVRIPSGDTQEVWREDGRVFIRVSAPKGIKGDPITAEPEDSVDTAYLSANGYVQSDEPLIAGLAKQAVGNAEDTLTAAVNIEKFVHEYITKKDLSAGYSTALEVAKSRQGDCTEHAVLTAALCRAAGIPARVACGVVYAEQFSGRGDIFGGHAWTECYVGGSWIGLDATMTGGFGSGHIKLAQGTGRPEDFFSLINMLGNFEIIDAKF
jgi:hypothetical protein